MGQLLILSLSRLYSNQQNQQIVQNLQVAAGSAHLVTNQSRGEGTRPSVHRAAKAQQTRMFQQNIPRSVEIAVELSAAIRASKRLGAT